MKAKLLILTLACAIITSSCIEQKTYEIPLTNKVGYGSFNHSFAFATPYDSDRSVSWRIPYLDPVGIPEDWTDVEVGDIDVNVFQTTYQNYYSGLVDKNSFEEAQKVWNWEPDSMVFSKDELKTKVAFVQGKDVSGKFIMKIDANNNLDFSDDESFYPVVLTEDMDIDSVVAENHILFSYEKLLNGKITEVSAPIFIAYSDRSHSAIVSFPQVLIAEFKGETLSVSTEGFYNLSYENIQISVIDDSIQKDENLILKNEFIEIKDKLYKNLGVNTNKNCLILEKVSASKVQLYSTQIGFKPFPIEEKDFISEKNISLDSLQGKYVLLEFWASWCGFCRFEISNLKELYSKTDREKFEIISIAGDSPYNQIKTIVENDSMSWPQLLSDNNNKLKSIYNIQGYPTSYLINPDGIIEAKNIRGREMVDTILDLLNE